MSLYFGVTWGNVLQPIMEYLSFKFNGMCNEV